ncbi:MAG: M50 family metallopeptidase [Clostridia bacterium]|nr:M50 family metallopeptidase [Clostridia bacterium]
MTLQIRKISLSFDYFTISAACLCAVLFPSRFLPAALCIAVHEFGHIAAIFYYGCDNLSVKLKYLCIDIIDPHDHTRPYLHKAVIALSGPAFNVIFFLILFFTEKFYTNNISIIEILEMVNISLAIFNLLPIIGTDGGEFLQSMLYKISEKKFAFINKKVNAIMYTLTILFLFPAAAAGFLVLLQTPYNFTLLASVLILLFRFLTSFYILDTP